MSYNEDKTGEIARARQPKRFLSGQADDPAPYIAAAKSYVSRLPPVERLWLHRKPYDPKPGNFEYFQVQYQLMNLIHEMQIRPGGRILEVGCGPGWVTELLLLLGFTVEAIEPAEALIEIARERCAALGQHYRIDLTGRLVFWCQTLEAAEFPKDYFDAVVFYDALHHVVDEKAAASKCFDFLRPGGVLGIVEGSWQPGNSNLAAQLHDEMRRYGTLENPFSIEYLDRLLSETGFVDLTRYLSVNGFFPVALGNQPLRSVATSPAADLNNLTARKPFGACPTTADLAAKTLAAIEVLSQEIDAQTRIANVSVRLRNLGETVWLSSRFARGHVTMALRRGRFGEAGFVEAQHRYGLPLVMPGDELIVRHKYAIPADVPLEGWDIDLISEGCFWFSQRTRA